MAEPAAVFRAVSLPGRKPRGEWRAAEIDVGTRSTCALVLNDPVVADLHCTLRAQGGGFVVQDRGSVTGTWHGGVAVAGAVPLASGDQIVIGVTRMTLEVGSEGGAPLLEIVVEEAGFHYKRPRPGEFHTDADEWVRSEVRFGRIPAVRNAAWAVLVASIAACTWLLASRAGERLLEPGRLDGSHAAAFATAAGGAGPHGTCATCHDRPAPASVDACVACHREMAGRHPFTTLDPAHDALLDAAVLRPADGCRICHDVGHGGRSAEETKARARAVLAADGGAATEGVCARCHADGVPAQAAALGRIAALAAALPPTPTSAAAAPHAIRFDAFSHAAHAGERAIACTTCHARDGSGKDLARPGFAACAACHVDWRGGSELALPDELPGVGRSALRALREELRGRGMLVQLDWHGSGPRCMECHAAAPGTPDAPAPELARDARRASVDAFAVVRAGHRHLVPEPGAAADCRGCHGDLASLAPAREPRVAPFLHASHVADPWPATDADQLAASRSDCLACHADVARSDALVAAPGGSAPAKADVATACAPCHVATPGGAPAIERRPGAPAEESVPRFSHARHGALAGGCFACHAFGAPEQRDPSASPALLAGVEDCSRCHAGHRNVAGGACAFCHADAPFASGAAPGLTRDDWPSGFQFDHYSGTKERGHQARVAADGLHAAGGCGECHDRTTERGLERVVDARRVSQVPPPDVRGWLCVECHARERGWFHWILPDARAVRAVPR